jgi:hypothetical protein
MIKHPAHFTKCAGCFRLGSCLALDGQVRMNGIWRNLACSGPVTRLAWAKFHRPRASAGSIRRAVSCAAFYQGSIAMTLIFSRFGLSSVVPRIILAITFVSLIVISGNAQCAKPGLVPLKTTFLGSNIFPESAADINGDGKPDFTYSVAADKVSIAFGDGTGGFGAPATYTVGTASERSFADLNGDGKPEMLVANPTHTLSIWMNDGSGAFTFLTTINHNGTLGAVVDLNNDNKGDLVWIANTVVNGNSGSFTVELGNGSGGFAPAVSYLVDSVAAQMTVFTGDFNGDGKPDIVAGHVNNATVAPTVFLNDGSGTLTLAATPSMPSVQLRGAADLNGDGRTDLFGYVPSTGSLRVALNAGANVYTQSDNILMDSFSTIPEAIDFNGDGAKDLFFRHTETAGRSGTMVLLNNGTGAFTPLEIRKPDSGFLVADFNGDGKTDFLTSATNTMTGEAVIVIRQGTCTVKNNPSRIDYDGDGFSEFAGWNPSTGNWFIRTVKGTNSRSIAFGTTGDLPAPGDFDGDGITDIAIFRPAEGGWYVLRSSDQTMFGIQFGAISDKPVPADYDGDGKSDIAVYRPSNGGWYYLNSSDSSFHGAAFGVSTDVPIPADFDGDGSADISVFRPSNQAWYRLNSSNGVFVATLWGLAGDRAVPADYDGDGKADIAVFRPSGGYWYVLRSYNGALAGMQYGQNGDTPLAGFTYGLNTEKPDFSVPAVSRPSSGQWWISGDNAGAGTVGVGTIPVASPYNVE